MLSIPDERLDLAEAKLELDRMVDAAVDKPRTLAQLDAIVSTIRGMPGGQGSDRERLTAVRTFIYEAGPWNQYRPFSYNLKDPYGRETRSKLLTHYLDKRLGNCVTMPTLFMILANRVGIEAKASTSPEHMFLRVMDRLSGRTFNVEATSGGHVARDTWYREKMPMTDDSVAKGVYLKTLTKSETVAVLATVVMEHYLDIRQPERAIELADVALAAHPMLAAAYVMKGSSYKQIIDRDFAEQYPTPRDIPLDRQGAYRTLVMANADAFARAEALGWRAAEPVVQQ